MKTISISFAVSTLFLCILFYTLQANAGQKTPRVSFSAPMAESGTADSSLIQAELDAEDH